MRDDSADTSDVVNLRQPEGDDTVRVTIALSGRDRQDAAIIWVSNLFAARACHFDVVDPNALSGGVLDSCELLVLGTETISLDQRRTIEDTERFPGTILVLPESLPTAGPVIAATGHDLDSDAAIEPGIDLAELAGRPLVLAHVWAMPGLGEVQMPPDPWGVGSIPAGQASALDGLVTQLRVRHPKLTVRGEVHQGHPVARELRDAATAAGAFVLVAARAGSPAIVRGRHRVGSVARGLLQDPVCPVLLVPRRIS